MSKTKDSMSWHDALLAIHQKLLLQTDIDSLLHTLKLSCVPVTPLQRINLILVVPLQQRVVIHTLEDSAHQSIFSKISITPTQEQLLLWYHHKALRYDAPSLQKDFPGIAGLQQYSQLHDCYHLPLNTPNNFLGAIQFIRTDKEQFNDDAIQFFDALAPVLTSTIANRLQIIALGQENTRLQQERDHLSILVDVTNTAISTLEMQPMVAEVAKEIYRYFGICYTGLILPPSASMDNSIRLFNVLHTPNKNFENSAKIHKIENTVLEQALKSKQPVIIKDQHLIVAQLSEQMHLLPAITKNNLQSVCFLPLYFGRHAYGVLAMAHDKADIFSDYNVSLLKQIADRVAIAVQNVLNYEQLTAQKEELKHENLYLTEQMQTTDPFGEIIGSSDRIRKVLAQIEMVANSDSTVLILGETGTGKELFAQAIHNRSSRNKERMIKMNCAAVPSGLLESELFGHEKGAFTGATNQRKGRFELAHESTLMLDEVGDIPLEMQPKLLRVLQEREIERLGSHKVIPIDVRLIASTNRNLKQMVEDKSYRADLYYRLNVFPILLPPLRDRKEDIPLLAQFFTKKLAKQMGKDIKSISLQTLKQLHSHHWPGNVRELANVIERAVILNSGTILNLQMRELGYPHINIDTTHQPIQTSSPAAKSQASTLSFKDEEEKKRIVDALKESNGIVAGPRGAAIKLGLKRTTLLSRMQKLGITTKDATEKE